MCSVTRQQALFQSHFHPSQKPISIFLILRIPQQTRSAFPSRSISVSPTLLISSMPSWNLECSLMIIRHGNVACGCLKLSLTMTRQDAKTVELYKQQDRKGTMLRAARGRYNVSGFTVRRNDFTTSNHLTRTTSHTNFNINLLPPSPYPISGTTTPTLKS